jgi:hypothetical protein
MRAFDGHISKIYKQMNKESPERSTEMFFKMALSKDT